MLKEVWDSIANRGLELLGKRANATSLTALCRELLSERGEASGTALARKVAEYYGRLTMPERETFFLSLLGPEFLPDPKDVVAAAEKYKANPNSETLAELFILSESDRQELFRRMNLAPGGTGAVVGIREDLLKFLPRHPELEPVNADLRHLLVSWFNRGFLRIERIDWRTPAIVLEKLIQHESVHEIHGWDDLRRRLQRDRRCFAFFHPALPNEPLIFVEVALTRGMVTSVQSLLDRTVEPSDPQQADTAIFYSINNCLDGLRGISFGSFLIKQVVAELEAEQLKIDTFITLSPIPRFRAWCAALTRQRRQELMTVREMEILQGLQNGSNGLRSKVTEQEQALLLRLCAEYLLNEKRKGRALDPVAAFHLNNGASVERILWHADDSPKGMEQSFGLMVNYEYRPSQIERNHEGYVKRGRIAASSRVIALLQRPKEPKRPAERP
jgi:malonyl-CoA decarboxylase